MTHWMEGDWPEDCEPEDQRDVWLKKLCRAIRAFGEKLPSVGEEVDEAFGEIECMVDDIEGMYEDDDPRSNGWVGDDGLP